MQINIKIEHLISYKKKKKQYKKKHIKTSAYNLAHARTCAPKHIDIYILLNKKNTYSYNRANL